MGIDFFVVMDGCRVKRGLQKKEISLSLQQGVKVSVGGIREGGYDSVRVPRFNLTGLQPTRKGAWTKA